MKTEPGRYRDFTDSDKWENVVSGGQTTDIVDATPDEVWDGLLKDRNAVLVDCRTEHEWENIGLPDLSTLGKQVVTKEWRQGPAMQINPDFESQLQAAIGERRPDRIYFLCRSGQRSLEAAATFQASLSGRGVVCACINVAEGFEGIPDEDGMRGRINGWQARGLPWLKGQ